MPCNLRIAFVDYRNSSSLGWKYRYDLGKLCRYFFSVAFNKNAQILNTIKQPNNDIRASANLYSAPITTCIHAYFISIFLFCVVSFGYVFIVLSCGKIGLVSGLSFVYFIKKYST